MVFGDVRCAKRILKLLSGCESLVSVRICIGAADSAHDALVCVCVRSTIRFGTAFRMMWISSDRCERAVCDTTCRAATLLQHTPQRYSSVCVEHISTRTHSHDGRSAVYGGRTRSSVRRKHGRRRDEEKNRKRERNKEKNRAWFSARANWASMYNVAVWSTERCLYKYIHKQANERRMTKRRLRLTVKSKIYREHCRETTTNSHVISNTHRSVRVFFFSFFCSSFILVLFHFCFSLLIISFRSGYERFGACV